MKTLLEKCVYKKEIRSHKQFQDNCTYGEIYEDISIEKLCKLYNLSLVSQCKNKTYDFKLSNNKTYEVKSKNNFFKYDELYIECARIKLNNNIKIKEPSGIHTTTSDYYIVTNHDKYYLVLTTDLLELCYNCNKIMQYYNTFQYAVSTNEFYKIAILI